MKFEDLCFDNITNESFVALEEFISFNFLEGGES